MGDVIKATRVILEELEPLNPVERGRVLGTMLALQGDCLTVQPGTPAPESTQEPTRAPKPYPKAGGATRSAPSGVGHPLDGGPTGQDLLPRLIEVLRTHPGMRHREIESALSLDEKAVNRALAAARAQRLISRSNPGRGCRYTLAKGGTP
mgnify:CR=1 FL=1